MQKRSSVIGGALMILVGVFFLALELFPEVAAQLNIARQWPLIIVALGGLFLISAFLGTPPLAIPGSIIGGIGGILYYQNLTGNWASWAYVWTLIIGFVGIGILLSSLLAKQERREIFAGVRLMVISLVLFGIFAAFFSGWGQLGVIGPVFLMLLGVWLLLRERLGK